jgi:hypothetical protein
MDNLTMSWNTEDCQLVCRWSGSEDKKSDLVVPTNEPLAQQFEDWNSDVVFELGDAA